MQLKLARTVLDNWDRMLDLQLPADIINVCLKFNGVGEVLAVDKTGAFFVAHFRVTKSKEPSLQNVSLEWMQSDPLKTPQTKDFMVPTNSTLCLTPNGANLFKIGGGYPVTPTVWSYDFCGHGLHNEWNVKIPRMKYARVQCAAVSLDNHSVIAIGGNERTQLQKRYRSVEMYDMNKEEWTELAPTHNERHGAVAVRTSESKCIVIGGDRCITQCEIYDACKDEWTQCAKTSGTAPIEVMCAGAAVWNDQIYVCGGWRHPQSAYQFDLHKQHWRKLADTNRRHQNSVVGIYYAASCAFVHGRNSMVTELYDERSNCWVLTVDSGKEHHPLLQRDHSFQGDIIILL